MCYNIRSYIIYISPLFVCPLLQRIHYRPCWQLPIPVLVQAFDAALMHKMSDEQPECQGFGSGRKEILFVPRGSEAR